MVTPGLFVEVAAGQEPVPRRLGPRGPGPAVLFDRRSESRVFVDARALDEKPPIGRFPFSRSREELAREALEYLALVVHRAAMVDQVSTTKSGVFLFPGRRSDQPPCLRRFLEPGNRGNVEEEFVPEEAARRRIGTGIEGFIEEGRHERKRADDASAESGHP